MCPTEIWDVVVVGGGPGGSAAALTLARSNLKVLLIEKERLPRHKMCSGFVSAAGAQKILRRDFNLEVPGVVCTHPRVGKGSKIFFKLGDEPQTWQDPYYNVWRRDFDFWLLIEADKAGAEVRDETSLISMDENENIIEVKARTKSERTGVDEQIVLKTRYLIAADGIASRVKRILFPDSKIHSAGLIQENWEGTIDLDPDYFHAFMARSLSSLYSWVNSKDGQLIIGVGAKKGENLRGVQSNFIQYLQKTQGLKLKRKIREEGCLYPALFPGIPASMQYLLGKGNCLLVGDAADLYDVMGEGIPSALISGRKAADAILEHLKNPSEASSVRIYENSMEKLMTRLKNNWEGFFTQLKNNSST